MSNRNRRQPAKQSITFLIQVKKLKLEHILSAISVIVTGIALFFAWQANRLTQEANGLMLKQVSEQLVITKILHLGGSEYNSAGAPIPDLNNPILYEGAPPDNLFCSHKIRLSNLGVSDTAVVNFSARATYTDEIVFLEGFGEAITSSQDIKAIHSLPLKDIQSILLSEDVAKSNPLNEQWLNNPNGGIELPISVSGKSSLDLVVHTVMVMNNSDNSFAGKAFGISYPGTTSSSETMEDTDNFYNSHEMPPFKVTYIFETVEGQIISTDPLTCWNIGIFSSGIFPNFITATPNP